MRTILASTILALSLLSAAPQASATEPATEPATAPGPTALTAPTPATEGPYWDCVKDIMAKASRVDADVPEFWLLHVHDHIGECANKW